MFVLRNMFKKSKHKIDGQKQEQPKRISRDCIWSRWKERDRFSLVTEQAGGEHIAKSEKCELCQNDYYPLNEIQQCGYQICQLCQSQEKVSRIPLFRHICALLQCGLPCTGDKCKLSHDSDTKEIAVGSLSKCLATSIVKCPAGCGWMISAQLAIHEEGDTGRDPENLPIEAQLNRDQYRIVCCVCPDTDFCAQCLTTPYHRGFSCISHQELKSLRRCRFCSATIPNDAPWMMTKSAIASVEELQDILKARNAFIPPDADTDGLMRMIADTETLADMCAGEECQKRASEACGKVLPCRHVCLGVRGESACLGCLQCPATVAAAAVAVSAEDLCCVCWTEPLRAAACLRLDCGHVFHLGCLARRLEVGWTGVRISFGFLHCPLCQQPMVAPALTKLLAPHLALQQAVLARAERRLALEGGDAEDLAPGGRYHGRPRDYAMDRFAFYRCALCLQPYFGGLRSCEVEAAAAGPGENLCGGCSTRGKAACPRHGDEAVAHKCRFCCAVASWYCGGSTHYCDPCHQRAGAVAGTPRELLPTCTPASCPLGVAHPPNGEEFALGCALCGSESDM